MNKKNTFITTCALLLAGCTHLYEPSSLKLETLQQAKGYSEDAHRAYLDCKFNGGRGMSCQQEAWEKYGAPDISEKHKRSTDLKRQFALTFVESMEELAAARVLQTEGHDCKKAVNVTDMLFHKGLSITCDNRIEYQLEREGEQWRVNILKQPKQETKVKEDGASS